MRNGRITTNVFTLCITLELIWHIKDYDLCEEFHVIVPKPRNSKRSLRHGFFRSSELQEHFFPLSAIAFKTGSWDFMCGQALQILVNFNDCNSPRIFNSALPRS